MGILCIIKKWNRKISVGKLKWTQEERDRVHNKNIYQAFRNTIQKTIWKIKDKIIKNQDNKDYITGEKLVISTYEHRPDFKTLVEAFSKGKKLRSKKIKTTIGC